jgi:hypothetical protein
MLKSDRKAALRRALAFLVLVGFSIGLSSCSLIKSPQIPWPGRAELVGSWTHDGPTNVQTELDLNKDGTLTVTNVPKQVFALPGQLYYSSGSELKWSQLVTLTGTWNLAKRRIGGLPAIDIRVAPNGDAGGVQTNMQVDGSGKNYTLSIVVGPIDNGVTFAFNQASN